MSNVLKDLEANAQRLRERTAALKSDVKLADHGVADLQTQLERAKQELASGTTTAENLAKLERHVEEARTVANHLREAQGTVEGDLARAEGELTAEKRRLEVERQTAEAEPLLTEAASIPEAFVQRLAGIHDMLKRRAVLAKEVAAKYPLAPQIEGIDVADLTALIEKQWRGPENRTWGDPDMSLRERLFLFQKWLKLVIAGPLFGDGQPKGFKDFNMREWRTW